MRPISDPADVAPPNVLYHSVFGFARVRAVDGNELVLDWERPSEGLPPRVVRDQLARVWSRCAKDGFFERALNDRDGLVEQMQVDPLATLQSLLVDLDEPQTGDDLRDWVVGRGLLALSGWERWWTRARELAEQDGRFRWDGTRVALLLDADPKARLENPLLSPARRLDLAVALRADIGEPEFRKHVLEAWRSGGTRVRDLALAALADAPPAEVLSGLIGPTSDAVDAVVHALRNGGWSPAEVGPEVCQRLVSRAVAPINADGNRTLDAEGRLAAALWRWGATGVDVALSRVAAGARGQEVLDAALGSLPPRRAETFAVQILDQTLATDDPIGSSFLAAWLTERAEGGTDELVERIAGDHPAAAARLRSRSSDRKPDIDDFAIDAEDAPNTVEITSEIFQRPSRWADLPPVGENFLELAISLVRALARHHAAGRVVSPTRDTVRVHPDGNIEIGLDADPRLSPRPPGEPPSRSGDVYAATVLLVEALVGRPWNRSLSIDRAIPFIRHIAPLLPPSAVAPLAAGSDPNVSSRVESAVSWLVRWQEALNAEADRAASPADGRGRIRAGYDTHVGRMKVLHTQTNQDALFVSVKGPQALLCVCDGISTANTGSGDLAASITTQVVASLWDQWLPRLVGGRPELAGEFVDRALKMANQAVCEASLRLAGGRLDGRVPMGTTAVVAVMQGAHAHIGWLGDSRAYLVGPYGASQLTADANQAGERMVDWQRGLLPHFDATGFALVRYVGHFDELGRAEPIPPLHTAVTLLPGERLVMCSDGVPDYAATNQAEVAAVINRLAGLPDPDEAARALIDAANRGGGGDNATAIVAAIIST